MQKINLFILVALKPVNCNSNFNFSLFLKVHTGEGNSNFNFNALQTANSIYNPYCIGLAICKQMNGTDTFE
jgi:hypothetical protein